MQEKHGSYHVLPPIPGLRGLPDEADQGGNNKFQIQISQPFGRIIPPEPVPAQHQGILPAQQHLEREAGGSVQESLKRY